MLENFEPGVIPALKIVMKLMQQIDEECYNILANIGDVPTFTLSWLLTWYSHIMPDLTQVQRIFDACLS